MAEGHCASQRKVETGVRYHVLVLTSAYTTNAYNRLSIIRSEKDEDMNSKTDYQSKRYSWAASEPSHDVETDNFFLFF